MLRRLQLVGISVALLAGVFAPRAAAQPLNCTAAKVTPASSIRIGPGAQSFSFDVDGTGQPTFQCNWTPVSSDAPWLTTSQVYFAPGGSTGFFGNLTAAIGENTTGATRTGHLTFSNGMGAITFVQEPSACVIPPATVQVPRAGGSITVPIQTAFTDCAWAVTTPIASWISVDEPRVGSAQWRESIGPASLVLTVSSNATGTGPRTATAKIGGVAVVIEQEAPLCVFAVSPASVSVPAGGASGTIALSGSGSDCSYTAATTGNVTITSGGSGTAPATIAYSVPPNTADSATTASITVGGATVQISQSGPAIATDAPPELSETYHGGVSFGVYRSSGGGTIVSAARRVTITNTSTPASGWSATVDQPWVRLSAPSGPTPGGVTISIDPSQTASLPLGISSATVSIASPVAGEGLRVIRIWLLVSDASNTAAPRGSFDTPNTQVAQAGAVPVTGWALDDIGIQRVVISRAAVSGETAGAEIYIGDAIRVQGARPDAEAVRLTRLVGNQTNYFVYPEATIAGWGYMLLSNVLPGGGNGTFTLMVDLYDLEGRVTRLPTRSVTFDNANATKPFGTIDEPSQGQTVSGTILNQGWVLTPQPKTIPFDGSTIKVYIDGVLVSPVTSYNDARPDVKALFPNLANSNGPGARLAIDTTKLTNGVHTIAWGVTDDAGAAEGIGSRYFTVQNGSSSLVWTPADTSRSAATVAQLPALRTDVWSRTGFDEAGWAARVETDAQGNRTLRASRGQRIELFLDPTLASACTAYEGHLLTGDVAGPLPMGASLDARHGIFRWQPGAEVSGRFNFAFVQRGCDGVERRISLTVAFDVQSP